MALVPNSSLIPPGGFHFVDRSGPKEFLIEGSSDADVIEKVLKYRLSNGRPPGNPAQEYIDALCGPYPHFCNETNPALVAPRTGASSGRSLPARVAEWIANFYTANRADPGVSWNESSRRADICCACPRNQEFQYGCGSCVDSINRLFFIWRRDRPVPREKELRACDVIGQHNGCAALSSRLPPVSDEMLAALPAQCWRKAP